MVRTAIHNTTTTIIVAIAIAVAVVMRAAKVGGAVVVVVVVVAVVIIVVMTRVPSRVHQTGHARTTKKVGTRRKGNGRKGLHGGTARRRLGNTIGG